MRQLFQFGDCGYWVARDYEHALELIESECGVEREEAVDDFVRVVPPEAEIACSMEDPTERCNHPKEFQETLPSGKQIWKLKLTAVEWVAEHPREFGYLFGGCQ